MVIVLPPAPTPLRPGAARRSSPWRDTTRWQPIAQRALALGGLAAYTGCRGHDDNGPEAGAHRVFETGRETGGGRLRLARLPGDADARGDHQGACGPRPRVPVLGAHGRVRGH